MASTSSITMQSFGKIVQRAPAVTLRQYHRGIALGYVTYEGQGNMIGRQIGEHYCAFLRPAHTCTSTQMRSDAPTTWSAVVSRNIIRLQQQKFVCFKTLVSGADLTGGHSCCGRRGPWEAGPWRPPGLGGPGRLNFGLQLQSPDWNLN